MKNTAMKIMAAAAAVLLLAGCCGKKETKTIFPKKLPIGP